MNINRNERDIEITYTKAENTNIAVVLDAIYEAAGLLYTVKSSSDSAVA